MTIFLATDQSIANNQFLGLGTASGGSKGFIRNSVVIPQAATITGLVLNIRDNALSAGQAVSGQIYLSANGGSTTIATGITATVLGPNPPNFCATTTVPGYPVTACELLSVQITTSGGALADGVAATIFLSI